jgi:hypothetical protein
MAEFVLLPRFTGRGWEFSSVPKRICSFAEGDYCVNVREGEGEILQ